MKFSNRTVGQAIGSSSKASGPMYHSIATIPRTTGSYDTFDIIGVVLFIGDKRMVKGAFEKQNSVSEIIITDHSSHQPLTVSAWNDMADFFKTKPAENQIIGFTSLRVTSHNVYLLSYFVLCFGLSTTMSFLIIPTPTGDKADSLSHWSSSHGSLLHGRKTQILKTRMLLNERQLTIIAFIKSKTAANTIQEEQYWIKALLENCSYNDKRKFIGCDQCNKKTDNERNAVFECPWCHKKESVAKPRLALTFDAHDSTDSIQLTAFNDTIAEFFGKTIDELYSPATYEHIESYQDIAQSLRVKPIEIQLGSTVALSKSGVLKWVLKSIAIARDTSTNPQHLACKSSDTHSSQESIPAQLTDATSLHAPEPSSASHKVETDTHSSEQIVPASLTIAPYDPNHHLHQRK
ncbi:replication protein A 70 kDa DNA-binding subunit B-like [Amaranthus tricolor]|uniref:replication protein A 70 kDa DNA-binding subunit B-like n=1 Tax=Amaranthus tricolor TaxID=29722 RepID=UPI00258C9DB2|nr:replication protein A 70 kDa DNA-binding subunit B-like [Amaranthus tricolor]